MMGYSQIDYANQERKRMKEEAKMKEEQAPLEGINTMVHIYRAHTSIMYPELRARLIEEGSRELSAWTKTYGEEPSIINALNGSWVLPRRERVHYEEIAISVALALRKERGYAPYVVELTKSEPFKWDNEEEENKA
jgi:hypothetical protein